MTKNEILQAFDNLGIKVEELHENFYHFEFEDVNYLYVHDSSDEMFLDISIPAIFEVTPENVDMVIPIINRTNTIIKYAKIVYSDDMVWASLEYPIFDGVEIEGVIAFAARLLQGAAYTFNKVLRGGYEDDNENEEDEI